MIEFRSFEDFDFTYHTVFKREDIVALLSDFATNGVLHESFNHVADGRLTSLSGHDFHHLLSDLLSVAILGIACCLNLVLLLFSKSNSEHSQEVAIFSFHIHESFNQTMPLFNELAELIASDIHPVEVRETGLAIYIFTNELKFTPVVGVMVALLRHQVRQGDFKDSSF